MNTTGGPWNLTPREAIALQQKLRKHVICRGSPRPRRVAGMDIGMKGDRARAAAVVLEYPSLEAVETRTADVTIRFPYIPGLLSFREIPALLRVYRRLRTKPDLLLVDGQGRAHPRRCGIACHLGLILDLPTIGCAKSRLIGDYREPGWRRGSWSPLTDDGETIGAAVRTQDHINVIYVSVGHRVSLRSAIRIALTCAPRYRIPEPTRLADRFAAL